MRVRDLEIALVLAREMKAATARSVDASLRLDQLQEVFGASSLDSAERARIQTALQMAGLEPQPSLLDADPTAPIRFAATAKAAAPVVTAGGGGPPEVPEAAEDDPAPEPEAADPAQTFPTVGQFARSKLGRSRRARRADRDDHGGGARVPPAAPADEHVLTEDEHDFAEVEDEPVVAQDEEIEHDEEDPVEEEPPVAEVEEPAHAEEPEPEPEHHPVDPRELDELFGNGAAAVAEAPEVPAPSPPAPAPAGARVEDVVATLLPAVAIPVIVTSVAGWRFGLPFVALSVIATGVLLARSDANGGSGPGLFATLRSSPATGLVLKTTAVVTVLSVVVSVLLASVGKNTASTTADKPVTPAKTPTPPAAAKTPTTPSKPANKPKKRRAHKPSATKKAPAPAADPGTEGLVRVPPKSSGTGPNGTGTPTTGTAPPSAGTPSTGTQGGTGSRDGNGTAP